MKLYQTGNVVFNLEAVVWAERSENGEVILHLERGEPLWFRGEAAEALWRVLEKESYLLTQSNPEQA